MNNYAVNVQQGHAMAVEVLGEAWKLGWKCTAHCLWFGPTKGGSGRNLPWCDSVFYLDMQTLVITRGERFPLARMQEVLKCPKCGQRKMRVLFEPPSMPKPKRIAAHD